MNQTQKPFTRLSHEQWQHIIDQQLESGLNQKEFCQTHGISLSTFSNWNRKLKESNSQTVQPQLDSHSAPHSDKQWIELPVDLPSDVEQARWHMELELPGGVILRMRQ